ncbi:uncharacterized protein MELLADRAFT_109803 [Melampsora larici-populina 98AG31]|uniref:Secreted protein n=1 Tax=Melampsora larici-populina (strain 98AG31 / pathotype 3-4-7) TaxID=747676 RepID=F4RXP3_MELLP|nr:uncharacterized protein MELLADRAFT_109803 [Melampsora larici-populina 98AG31]EGG02862.1 hypothetical protein MELLADRAFT_109803 [Melampsora larici-populina 98AG31]
MSRISARFSFLYLLEILIWNIQNIESTPTIARSRTQYLPKLAEDLKSGNSMSGSSTIQRISLDMKGKGVMPDISDLTAASTFRTMPPSPVSAHISQMNRKLSPKPPKIPNKRSSGTKVNAKSNLGEARRASSNKEVEEASRKWEMDFRTSITSWYHGSSLGERDYATTRGIRQSQLSKQLEDAVPGIEARKAIQAYSYSTITDLRPLEPIFKFLLQPEGSTKSKLDGIELLSLLVSHTELSMRYTRTKLNVGIEMADKCLQFQNLFLRITNLYHDNKEIYQHAALAHTILTRTLNRFWRYTYPDLMKIADLGTDWSSASRADISRLKSMDVKSNRARRKIDRYNLVIRVSFAKIEGGLKLRRDPAILSTDLSALKPLIEILTKEEGNTNSRVEIATLIAYLAEDTMDLTLTIKNPEQIKRLRERLQSFRALLEPFSLPQNSYLQGYQKIVSSTYDRLEKRIGKTWATGNVKASR